tara:strand:- start:1151 stop:1333 length:183 start_codon:yes stop_codon:yes gene_type:complete
MVIKVRETWIEIVEKERIIEANSLEEAMDEELELGEGEVVAIELQNNSLNHEILEEDDDE